MSLADAILGALPELRAEAEARMLSRATIRRHGEDVVDEEGYEVDGWEVVDTDCPGRLAGSRNAGATRSVTVGGVEMQLAVREWHMPAAKPSPLDGDYIDITDGENAGLVLRVVEAVWQDQATARRVPVVEVPRPEEWA